MWPVELRDSKPAKGVKALPDQGKGWPCQGQRKGLERSWQLKYPPLHSSFHIVCIGVLRTNYFTKLNPFLHSRSSPIADHHYRTDIEPPHLNHETANGKKGETDRTGADSRRRRRSQVPRVEEARREDANSPSPGSAREKKTPALHLRPRVRSLNHTCTFLSIIVVVIESLIPHSAPPKTQLSHHIGISWVSRVERASSNAQRMPWRLEEEENARSKVG